MDDGADEVPAEDAILDRFLPRETPEVLREHHVTAILVARDGQAWVPRALSALVSQERAPDQVVLVDAGSSDDTAQLLVASGYRVVSSDPALGYAGAVAAGVAAIPGRDGPGGPVGWYWLLHDDSAPDPTCLAQLLLGSDRTPAATLVGPKAVAWSDPEVLVSIGHLWAPGTPVVEKLEPRERDQGQYDVDRPVYALDTAGVLVRASTWQDLDGLDGAVPDWASGADLSRRVWGSGGVVQLVPAARVAHRQARHHAVRAPGTDQPRRAARAGQLYLELTQAPAVALPWRVLRAVISSVVRALAVLLTREPEEASAELAGAWDMLAHPGRVRAGRRRLRRPPVTDVTRPAHVRAYRGTVLRRAFERWTASARVPRRPAGGWRAPRWLARPLLVAAVLATAALVRDPGQLVGSGLLQGGGLLPAPGSRALLADYLQTWHDTWMGTSAIPPIYLAVLSGVGVLALGSVDAVLRVMFGMAVPLAFLSAYAAVGHRVPSRQRILMAVAWATLPAGVAAAGAGRISTLALLLLGPLTARALVTWWTGIGRPGIRRSLVAGTMLGITAGFAPLAWVLAGVAGIGAWAVSGLRREVLAPGAVVLLSSLAFVALWGTRLADAPWLLLTDLGRSAAIQGAPAAWVWGLAPGGASSSTWPAVPLVVTAVLAVLLGRPGKRSVAVLAGALLLMVGVAWTAPLVRARWPEVDPDALWPGQPLLVAGGLLAVLVVRMQGAPRPARLGLRVAWVVCVASLVVGWWTTPGGPTTVTPDAAVPPVVSLDAAGPGRPRALVVTRADGVLLFGVASGPAEQLGDADALAGAQPSPGLVDTVASLVSGAGGSLERELGGRGIRYVVFDGPPSDAVVVELDAAVGLRRLASSSEQSLWLVAGDPVRARLAATATTGPVDVPILTTPTSVDVVLHPMTALPRRLTVAELADPGWSATLDGRPLPLGVDDLGELRTQVAATGELTVRHDGPWRWVGPLQLGVLAALVVLALPKRRPDDVDGVPR